MTNGIRYSWVKSTPSTEIISIQIAVSMVKDYSLDGSSVGLSVGLQRKNYYARTLIMTCDI